MGGGKRLQERPDIAQRVLVDYRLGRLREQLRAADVGMCILVSPISLRYALDFRDYALFQAHIPTYYAFVATEGPVAIHATREKPTGIFDELRTGRGIGFFNAGPNLDDEAPKFAQDVEEFLRDINVGERRIAAEYINPSLTQALLRHGFEVIDAVDLVEYARAIKSSEEIECIRWSIQVAEEGIRRMREALAPGITENQLWALLHKTNIEHDGDWCDGRMLCSGERTNPWLQEATDRVIEAGDLVALDTDMLGPFGYCADISRTFLCGEQAPSDEQRDLYRRAYDEVHHNMSLIRPGLSYHELSQRGFVQPDEFIANRYPCLAHGVGMCDEYPKVYYRQDWKRQGYDGVIEKDMVLCIESYVGADGETQGVKLEQQILVTDNCYQVLSTYPFEDAFL